MKDQGWDLVGDETTVQNAALSGIGTPPQSPSEDLKERNYGMNIEIIEPEFSVCKISALPSLEKLGQFCFIGKTDEELSLVCPTQDLPESVTECDHGWRAFRIQGVLDFSLVGVLAKLSALLAGQKIGIVAISTYNTDYILTKTEQFDRAVSILEQNGYRTENS